MNRNKDKDKIFNAKGGKQGVKINFEENLFIYYDVRLSCKIFVR